MAAAGYFARRWHGQVPAARLFWHDMVGVAGAVNLLVSFAALMLMAQGAATWLAALLHFSPLPYNFFLFTALWRLPQRSPLLSALAWVWLLLVCVF